MSPTDYFQVFSSNLKTAADSQANSGSQLMANYQAAGATMAAAMKSDNAKGAAAINAAQSSGASSDAAPSTPEGSQGLFKITDSHTGGLGSVIKNNGSADLGSFGGATPAAASPATASPVTASQTIQAPGVAVESKSMADPTALAKAAADVQAQASQAQAQAPAPATPLKLLQ
ncbi:MAG: hypothetical protein HQK81_11975 [Desulfovibrionaceae bacterium]|nr:hypothetical protein [Desulfovibrionaceae bacterium]MBF0514760.1 hypothetical protein [Desulfovibrionaceae bacterium]